jgi:hypothetical protein
MSARWRELFHSLPFGSERRFMSGVNFLARRSLRSAA